MPKKNSTPEIKPPLTTKQINIRLALSFAFGVIICFSFAPFYAWAVAIFFPCFQLKIWNRLPRKFSFLSGWLFGAGMFGAGASWVYQSISHFSNASALISLSVTLLFVAYLALYYGLLAYVLKRFVNLKSNLQILLAFPSLWIIAEWCVGHVITGFPWLLIGYSQIHSPLHVFAPIVGVYGLSFITIFMAAILEVLTRQGQTKSYWWTWGLLALIVILSIIAKHIHWTHPTATKQPVAIVQANLLPTTKWDPQALIHIEKTYQTMSQPLWQKNNLLVWPESALPTLPVYIAPWLKQIQKQIDNNQSHLITGIITQNKQGQFFNTAMLLSYNQPPQLVMKRHLVPFGEYFPLRHSLDFIYKRLHVPMSDLTAGSYHQALLHFGLWKIAPYICYEIAYPEEVMDTFHNANLLLVISDDSWFGSSLASYQHLGITQMRAMETGRYAIFSNNSGPSAIVLPSGKVMKLTKQESPAILQSEVTAMTGKTPFMTLKNWPIFILAFLLLIICLLLQLKVKHQSKQDDNVSD